MKNNVTRLEYEQKESEKIHETLKRKNKEAIKYFETDNRSKTDKFENSSEKLLELEKQISFLVREKQELRDLYLESKEKCEQIELDCYFKSRCSNERIQK